MTSLRLLRVCLQGLVILNLVFVQMTGAAEPLWLLPLYAGAFAAPALERFHDRLGYRVAWNGVVLCCFTLLMSHALGADLAYVLQDGLLLAALCQVHLLNNLRADQRPDLLFTNAYLIAIITGFMTRSVAFAGAFLLFAPFYVVGQQILSASRDGRDLPPSVTRALARDGLRRSGVLLALSLLAFLFWPRDFDRKPLLQGTFDISSGSQQLELGFNERLELNRSGRVEESDSPALTITLLEGDTGGVSSLWRGSTLGTTTGSTWHPVHALTRRDVGSSDPGWRGKRGALRREVVDEDARARVEVLRHEQGTDRLFAPLGALALELTGDQQNALLRPRHDGTVDTAAQGDVRYELLLGASRPSALGGALRDSLPVNLSPFLELPDSPKLRLARELAQDLADQGTFDEQHELVEHIRSHLARQYAYLPPGAEGAARSLEDFLRGEGGGHCEFYASALTVMLRTLDVPARVVTGYRSSDWDAAGETLRIGLRDAHAWVEVHDPLAGWYSADASPIGSVTAHVPSLWSRVQDQARSAWETVTDFDSDRRAALFAWARTLPGRGLRWVGRHPLAAAGAAAALAALVALVRAWVLRRSDPDVRHYGRTLQRLRLQPQEGETPRELLVRAEALELPPERLQLLRDATAAHERARYAA